MHHKPGSRILKRPYVRREDSTHQSEVFALTRASSICISKRSAVNAGTFAIGLLGL